MIKQYILNKTPIRTSNNYKINDITLDINKLELNISNNIEIINDENEKLDIKIDKEYYDILNSKIGLSFEKKIKI